MSSSAGFYFFDLDDPDSAMRYCGQARAAAQEAHNTDLAIYALCTMSNFSSSDGKAHAGLDFAAATQSLVDKTGDALLRICVADRAGTAYGIDGQYKHAWRSSTGRTPSWNHQLDGCLPYYQPIGTIRD